MDYAADEYTPFISKGVIQALGSSELIPITILWDTGANQSLLLGSRLSQLQVTFAGASTLTQGVELETVSVLLHKSYPELWHCLSPSDGKSLAFTPIKEINLILGIDLAGEKVTAIPYMLNSSEEVQSYTNEVMVYPACIVTRAMTKWTQGKSWPLEKVATTKKDGEE